MYIFLIQVIFSQFSWQKVTKALPFIENVNTKFIINHTYFEKTIFPNFCKGQTTLKKKFKCKKFIQLIHTYFRVWFMSAS